ncbi:MAG: DUF1294 domain-containing protein [Clostridiales bacterium]|nr:DUF1294 domain-containing protein [Clostridiales bacterium]
MLKIVVLIVVLVANGKAFYLFGDDKQRAILGLWRIPEERLMASAMTGGIGAYLGMQIYRHKTCKGSFPVVIPILAVIQILLIAGIMLVL